MTNPIYLPRGFQEFKRQVAAVSPANRPVFSLHWNDLSQEGKEKLAQGIKTNSHSMTLRNSPKAPLDRIILALDTVNPVLDTTMRPYSTGYRSWAFTGSCTSTRTWLDKITSLLVLTLQLRKQNQNRFYLFYAALEGWPYINIARSMSDIEESYEAIVERGNTNTPDTPEEISMQEVRNASQSTIRRNNN